MSARRRFTGWVAIPFGIVVAASLVVTNAGAADPVPGSQGIDTSLPATDSQVTVNGRGQFADLAITVNQTENLTNQAVSITWEGGVPTTASPGRFGGNYLQIMQCWGDDDGSVPDNPGPPPEQCVQGATDATYGGVPGGVFPPGYELSRIISDTGWTNFDESVGVVGPGTSTVWRPFRAVDGTQVDVHTDPNFNPDLVGGSYWLNPFFNIVTTNEVAGAATGLDGRGAELMQLNTGVESSGLGCGRRVQPTDDGGRRVPRCWIVVVPRGSAVQENAGTPFEDRAEQFGVFTSPLAPDAWTNRIAIPVGFNPVDSPCALGADERRVAGSELAIAAVARWQPALCGALDLPPFAYAPVGDSSARQQLTRGGTGAPGMAVVSQPIPETAVDADNPVVYAPLTLSGIVIGFNVERNPTPNAPQEEQDLAGVRVAELNLTPRLVAKLLTQSYTSQVTIVRAPSYGWLESNPPHLGLDPDFRQFNQEFTLLETAVGRTFGGLQLPTGNSDAARQVWEWVLADPEAQAWLDGEPDEWGMQVNPAYSTDSTVNPSGSAFGEPLPTSFPKADPYCYQAPQRGGITPPPLCGTDWLPYSRGLVDSARITRVADDGARIVENTFSTTSADVWKRELPQRIGKRSILSVTDTPSAARFGLQTARLSRAGDNGADRAFIAADPAALTAGVTSFVGSGQSGVLVPSPTTTPAGAYPLTTLTYAAVTPLSLNPEARSDYASFIEYAADAGQVPGPQLGQLPDGYAQLPLPLRIEAMFAAFLVREMIPPAVIPQTPPPDPPTAPFEPTTSMAPLPVDASSGSVEEQTGESSTGYEPGPSTGSSTRSSSSPRGSAAPSVVPTVSEAPSDVVEEPTPQILEPQNVAEPDSDEPENVSPLVTPILAIGRSRYAVPGLGAIAMFSMLGALEITKRPRRRLTDRSELADDVGTAPDA